MDELGFPVEVVSGVPAVTTPEEIDIANAPGFRSALVEAAARGHESFVVDMSRTQFVIRPGFTPWWRGTGAPRLTAVRCCWSSRPPRSSGFSRSPALTA
jgi:hypothetical protein